MSELGRYLVDYENPDAGIGHSLGHVNNAVKICLRHGLTFAYSDSQVRKSSSTQWVWRIKQWIRRITFRQVYETHNIGDDINALFGFSTHTKNRSEIELLLRNKKLRLVQLPATAISIPSNCQDDDEAYRTVDEAVRANPEDGIVFLLPEKRTGDFEYAATRAWFKRCYDAAGQGGFPEQYAPQLSDTLKVAVHVRRGDLLPGRQFADLSKRMLPDAWYLQILTTILQSSGNRALSVYVVSEGLNGGYCSENGVPVNWHELLPPGRCKVIELIDSPFIESFRVLTGADILVGSKSGMTHLAGMLGGQTKFVPSMWHSYRGADGVLELGDALGQEDLQEIARLTSALCLSN
ncbi:hypothetical protein RAE21_05860 [Rhodoferax sp. TBRC 17198]|uniref:hypothetical protein n=1 Tax=Rhodoferax potami TaxID=3068338 RepID=UPI0028BD7BAA|nr:hypothetical protein [Rhodoferax sp. TBRC 17198]MDT7521937.1 hypothetical protein [Rhodoferax sp. TBRC 17198]